MNEIIILYDPQSSFIYDSYAFTTQFLVRLELFTVIIVYCVSVETNRLKLYLNSSVLNTINYPRGFDRMNNAKRIFVA